jgi:hypothetical protein
MWSRCGDRLDGGGFLDSQPCSVLGGAGEPWKTLVKFTNSLIGGEPRSSLACFARYVRRVLGCKSAESCEAELPGGLRDGIFLM